MDNNLYVYKREKCTLTRKRTLAYISRKHNFCAKNNNQGDCKRTLAEITSINVALKDDLVQRRGKSQLYWFNTMPYHHSTTSGRFLNLSEG